MWQGPRLAALQERERLRRQQRSVPEIARAFLRLGDAAMSSEGSGDWLTARDELIGILADLQPDLAIMPWRRDPHCVTTVPLGASREATLRRHEQRGHGGPGAFDLEPLGNGAVGLRHLTEAMMAQAVFKIVGSEGAWRITGQGDPTMSYVTKEAAFEAAVIDAGTHIKQGNSVLISVAGSDPGESALGDRRSA